MADTLADRVVEAAKRALVHRGRVEVPEDDLRVAVAAAFWELAAWAEQRNPEVQLGNPQRAAIRDLAQSIDGA